MLISNFNCVLNNEKTSSKKGTSTLFLNWVRRNELTDLGYIGNQYTWRHGVNMEMRKEARLNRALCCDEWKILFPSVSVRYLGHAHSDHSPLFLEVNGAKAEQLEKQSFRFQVAWLLHTEFFKMMEREWVWRRDLTC